MHPASVRTRALTPSEGHEDFEETAPGQAERGGVTGCVAVFHGIRMLRDHASAETKMRVGTACPCPGSR